MKNLLCPGCGESMHESKEPDVVIDVCSNCGGKYFDKSELNIIATGLSGDIEYCSIDKDSHEDQFPSRMCPKCDNQTMKKINLLGYSNIIFDYCSECGGLYLDKGEAQDMNVDLEQLATDKHAEEFRGYINSHLVRLDKLSKVEFIGPGGISGMLSMPSNSQYLRVSVYYNRPLECGMRISSEKWKDKFLKVIGLFKEQDIVIGNKELDNQLIIQGEKIEEIKSILLRRTVETRLKSFLDRKPAMVSTPAQLEILDNRIVCTEGPYREDINYDVEEDTNDVVELMISLADAIEGVPN